tara:strand:+ start:310 stop:426 length:117 start_codon:yes stop_codon:yes gene_type:complete
MTSINKAPSLIARVTFIKKITAIFSEAFLLHELTLANN